MRRGGMRKERWRREEGYSQLVDAAVVEFDLCADQHLTRLLGVQPQLYP